MCSMWPCGSIIPTNHLQTLFEITLSFLGIHMTYRTGNATTFAGHHLYELGRSFSFRERLQ